MPGFARTTLRLLCLLALAGAAFAFASGFAGPAPATEAALTSAACPNPGIYSGTDTTGDFQTALENAVNAANTCAGCCDQLINYEVVETSGRFGGIAGFDDVTVEIKASW